MTIAVIFTSVRSEGDDDAYAATAAHMAALAAGQPGFVDIESVRDPKTRRGITVSYWEDDASARTWKEVAEHLAAQEAGRERWYSEYEVVVAEVTRRYRHPA